MTARWRIKAWIPDIDHCILKRHYQHNCKLCVVARAIETAERMADVHHRASTAVKWSVEKIDGHLNGWVKVFDSEDRIGQWVKRHGH
jgi:hypothetical protein